MINPAFLDLIERFQTTLVGAVGLLGVIWTLRANAKNARAEHQRQLDTKLATLRRILAAEFRNYSRALRGNVQATPPDDGLYSVGRVRRVFSESLATDLGLLELGEIDVVVNALISIDGFDHFLENLSPEHTVTRFLIPAASWDEFCKGASTTADTLDIAVQALELTNTV